MAAILPVILSVLAPLLQVLLPWLFSGSVTSSTTTARASGPKGMDVQ